MWYIICDGRVITCTQTIANMVVVDDRAMTNVHVVDNRSPWPINVTGFAKRGLPHTTDLSTSTIHNFKCVKAMAL